LFEDEFSGEALTDICPRAGAKDGPEINVKGGQKEVACKLGGV
jgi:hypothetical protein